MLEVIFQKWFPLVGEKPQEDRKGKESLRERFIKNKRLLNPTHISF
jgi:hypothetical protein